MVSVDLAAQGNNMKKTTKKITDFQKVKKFCKKNKIPCKQGSTNGITPYILFLFTDDGEAFIS